METTHLRQHIEYNLVMPDSSNFSKHHSLFFVNGIIIYKFYHREAAIAIIKSAFWQDALKNESYEFIPKKQETTPLRQLIEKMPGEFLVTENYSNATTLLILLC